MADFLKPRKSTILQTGLLDQQNLIFSLPSSRIRWKTDTSCKCCLKSLKSTIIKPKKACQFCYRAVCKQCSKQRTRHPQTRKQQRVCDECYQNAVQKQFREGYSDELIKVMTDKDQLQNQLKKEQEGSQKLSSQIQRLEQLIKQFSSPDEKYKALQEKISDLQLKKQKNFTFCLGVQAQITQVQNLEEDQFRELDKYREQILQEKQREKYHRQAVLKLRNQLAQAQDQKIRTLKILEQKRFSKGQSRSKKQEKFLKKLEKLTDQLGVHQQQNQKLQEQLDELQVENDELDMKKTAAKEQLRNLNKHPAHSLLNNEDKKLVMELIVRISTQQKQLEMLQTRLALSNGLNII